MNSNVQIKENCDEADQVSNFANGTLQGFGPNIAVTIQTKLVVPPKLDGCSQTDLVDYLHEVLGNAAASANNMVTFDVQVGRSDQ